MQKIDIENTRDAASSIMFDRCQIGTPVYRSSPETGVETYTYGDEISCGLGIDKPRGAQIGLDAEAKNLPGTVAILRVSNSVEVPKDGRIKITERFDGSLVDVDTFWSVDGEPIYGVSAQRVSIRLVKGGAV